MQVQIKKLELTNYRNIPHATYEFNGNSKIVGENKVGKTNTLESIYYLLTDKLLDGSVDIAQIKPLANTKEKVTVEGTFDVDGKEVKLKKVYYEQWTKTRGEATLVFKGHTTDYFYNDAKQDTKKMYETIVAELFRVESDPRVKIDFMQLLINPTYLGEMGEGKDWTNLREFIIRLVGDINDDDVFFKEPRTAVIKPDLETYNGKAEQVKKFYKSQANGVQEKITGYGVLIEQLEKTPCPEEDEIELSKKALEESETKISNLRNAKGIDVKSQEIQKKLNSKESELNELVAADLERKNQPNPELDAANKELDTLRTKFNGLLDSKTKLNEELQNLRMDEFKLDGEIERCTQKREQVIKDYTKNKELLAKPNLELECPHCHRPYEPEVADKLKAEYESNIKAELDRITVEGKENKELLTKYTNEKASIHERVETAEAGIDALDEESKGVAKKIAELRDKVHELTVNDYHSFKPNPKIETLQKEIKDIKADLLASQCEFDQGNRDIANEISIEQNRQNVYKKVLDDKAYYDRQMDQLEKTRESLAAAQKELIAYEQKSDLLALFIKTKLNLLDENVSKVFGNIKFKLIEPNINGGYDTVCKPYIFNVDKGESTNVTWKSGSKSEKVVTGIEIAEAIKTKLVLPNLPYLFDEGGEISSETFATRFKTQSQLICVKVKDNIPNPVVMAL